MTNPRLLWPVISPFLPTLKYKSRSSDLFIFLPKFSSSSLQSETLTVMPCFRSTFHPLFTNPSIVSYQIDVMMVCFWPLVDVCLTISLPPFMVLPFTSLHLKPSHVHASFLLLQN
uniref:Uncharacterized protein n=1 Tax=Lotus japonicus TaxID=34305 RepID=I3SAN6_LOTJA|nr:unknown [Lotus japonicus]